MNRGARPWLAFLAGIAGFGVCVRPEAQEQSAPRPGLSYASLEQLPDWSGWWLQDLPPEGSPPPFARAPFLPEIAESLKDTSSKLAAGVDPADLGFRSVHWYCSPSFAGYNGGFEEYVELLFTPGRVTIANESGLVRRIVTDGQPLPADLEESHSGTSVGHWEGPTLVVETGGLNHDAPYIPGPVGIKLGRNVRTVERISLVDSNTLEIVQRMTAPYLFTVPFETTARYRRDRAHVFRESGHCEDLDRSIDPVTGRTRFEMTPPTDLPPP